MRTRFLRFFLCAALAVPSNAPALMTGGNNTNALTTDPGFPEGALALANLASRVGYTDGPLGGMYHFLYRGDEEAFNQALAMYAAVYTPTHDVIVHDGPGTDQFLAFNPRAGGRPLDPSLDWSITIWATNLLTLLPTNGSTGLPSPESFRVDVYVGGGRIDWSKVSVPTGVQVHDERIRAQTNSTNAPARPPLSYRDPDTGIIFYVESDGHHVVALDKDGKVLWRRLPATDGNLPPYSAGRPMTNPEISRIGDGNGKTVGISFRSRQFGYLDEKTGDLTILGQD